MGNAEYMGSLSGTAILACATVQCPVPIR